MTPEQKLLKELIYTFNNGDFYEKDIRCLVEEATELLAKDGIVALTSDEERLLEKMEKGVEVDGEDFEGRSWENDEILDRLIQKGLCAQHEGSWKVYRL